MGRFSRMSKDDLKVAIEETRKMIEASKTYLKFLATGQGLPKSDAARDELAASHTKLIDRLGRELDELETELHGRP